LKILADFGGERVCRTIIVKKGDFMLKG